MQSATADWKNPVGSRLAPTVSTVPKKEAGQLRDGGASDLYGGSLCRDQSDVLQLTSRVSNTGRIMSYKRLAFLLNAQVLHPRFEKDDILDTLITEFVS